MPFNVFFCRKIGNFAPENTLNNEFTDGSDIHLLNTEANSDVERFFLDFLETENESLAQPLNAYDNEEEEFAILQDSTDEASLRYQNKEHYDILLHQAKYETNCKEKNLEDKS
ncbi:hypothetical protein ENBRE01_2648 [Enteropsectra breve]|nr:hypothetical protein ENBRE01_2648 [Enteropsectra breve]